MSRSSLQERLSRLRPIDPDRARPSAASPAPAGREAPSTLATLERALVGNEAPELSLKARLERLVAATAQRERPRQQRGVPLAEAIEGQVVETDHGTFFSFEESVALDRFHGSVTLSRLRTPAGATLGILAGEPGFEGFDLTRCAYLDTETTGLSGGTGTAAFLIGVGFVRDERFVVRQYFMRDYDEEVALLHHLAEDLSGFQGVVTFNGKMFDLPLLESRFRLNRVRYPLDDALHLDLLHPARRLWKARLGSCRLVHLEAALLGLGREDDVPGDQIPQVYFDFIRSGDARLLARVFRHNLTDIVSLAALSALACEWIDEGLADDPRDALSLARVLDRAGEGERSLAAYRRAIEISRQSGSAYIPVERAALRRLAQWAKLDGDLDAAVKHWESALAAGDVLATRELAILHEHYRRDLKAALVVVEAVLDRLDPAITPVPSAVFRDLEHRCARLRRRLARESGGGASS
jgi:uncharacterized protein YprB with RNaseH-like and TPR domain